MNIKPLNLNFVKSLENLFAGTYESDKLVQAIINTKAKKLQKLPSRILKQVKFAIGNLEVKMINYTLEVKSTYLTIKNCYCIYCKNIMTFPSKDILTTKLCFKAYKLDIIGLI